MTTATASPPPRELIGRVFALDATGTPQLSPVDRGDAVRWLRRALVDFDSLDKHIAILQDLAGAAFTYPRPRRDRWPDAPADTPAAPGFRHTSPLSADRLQAVMDRGPELLTDAELADLLLNPVALFDTFDAIDEAQPDIWLDEMTVVGRELAVGQGTAFPRPGPPGKPSRARVWGQRIAALAACLVVGVLLGRLTRPEGDGRAEHYAENDRKRLEDEAARLKLEVARLERGMTAAKALVFTSGGSGVVRSPEWKETWARRYSTSRTATQNLEQLEPFAPPEIIELIRFMRASNRTDSEIIEAIRPTKQP